MEEMDRYEGFWLSPKGDRVCFEQVDETDVKLISIPRPGDAEDPGAAEEHRYPFSGATNPSVKLGVVGVSGGDVAWLRSVRDRYLVPSGTHRWSLLLAPFASWPPHPSAVGVPAEPAADGATAAVDAWWGGALLPRVA